MSETIVRPPTDQLPSWNREFINFVDEKINLPDDPATRQIREYELVGLELPMPVNRAKFERILISSPSGLILGHHVHLMFGNRRTESVEHTYSEANQEGQYQVTVGQEDMPLGNKSYFLRVFVTKMKEQRLRLPGDEPNDIRVALVH